MGRKKTLIVYPHLNDCGGNTNKQWYVEYKYRVPGNPNMIKKRIYKDLNVGTIEERYKKAKEIISEKRKWLESGKHLTGDDKEYVYEDELTYSNVARLYGKRKKEVPTIRQNISNYLAYIKNIKSASHYLNIQGNFRVFIAWLEKKELNVDITFIKRTDMINFFIHLANDLKLSRPTIKDYIGVIKAFFDYEIDREIIEINPVARIPVLGQIVDNSPEPFTDKEKKLLKELIKPNDAQLWLACQILDYCALRPGMEMRLMRIGWIDFDKRHIRVPNISAKNQEAEIVEIPDPLYYEMINTYQLDEYDRDLFVFGNKGVPGVTAYGKNTLRNRFNRYRDKLNISKDKVFYSWKHSGAIDLIENGLPPFSLQDHLRHKSFSTTEIYIKKRIKSKERKISKFTREL